MVVFHGSGIVSILARAGWCVCVVGGVGTGRDGLKGR